MVTGSVAAIIYGAPRMTHDVDLLIDIPSKRAGELKSLFPDSDFYCPPIEILVAELDRIVNPHFNLIHHKSGFKADIYPARDWMERWGMGKRTKIDWNGLQVSVAPPEYVIVRKMDYYREGGSEKHLLDIQKMLAVVGPELDMAWIEDRVGDLELYTVWKRVKP